ncbi:hypothetical protein BU064_00635 [Staphylococcus succinus]|nr:hypothetical protein BU064_00635 [Staphylococcus succinus]
MDNITFKFIENIIKSVDNIGDKERIAAKNAIIDFLATAFASSGNKHIQQLIDVLIEEHGPGTHQVIGYDQGLTASDAALVNGFILHYYDYDDVHSDLRGHASSVIFPALLSHCQKGNYDFQHFIDSYIVGIEVAARIGRTIGKQHYEEGWHTSSTIGILGATAACSYFLALDKASFSNALGIAITEASGMRAQFGTDVKPLHIGLAAQKAYMAIIYSKQHAIEGNKNMLPTFYEMFHSPHTIPTHIYTQKIENWAIQQPGLWFKLYPCCSANYHAIDATISLQEQYHFKVEDIAQINVIFPTNGDAALKFSQPKNGLEGRFSVEFVIAKLLMRGTLTLDDFLELTINQDIQDVMSKIQRIYNDTIIPDDNALPIGRFTIVEIITHSQEIYSERVDAPRGSPNQPLSQAVLIEKLKMYAPKHAENIATLDQIKNTNQFIAYIATGG